MLRMTAISCFAIRACIVIFRKLHLLICNCVCILTGCSLLQIANRTFLSIALASVALPCTNPKIHQSGYIGGGNVRGVGSLRLRDAWSFLSWHCIRMCEQEGATTDVVVASKHACKHPHRQASIATAHAQPHTTSRPASTHVSAWCSNVLSYVLRGGTGATSFQRRASNFFPRHCHALGTKRPPARPSAPSDLRPSRNKQPLLARPSSPPSKRPAMKNSASLPLASWSCAATATTSSSY